MASVAALTELAALWPGDVVVVDDVLAPPSLRMIIDELDFAYWWPTEIGWRQASGAFKRGVSLGRRSESTSEVWLGEELRREIALLEERICPALRRPSPRRTDRRKCRGSIDPTRPVGFDTATYAMIRHCF